MIKNAIIYVVAILLFSACTNSSKTKATEKAADTVTANEPTIKDYVVGEQWAYTWKTASEEKILAKGKDIKEVVVYKKSLGFLYGTDTVQITNPSSQKSATPNKDWPLEVGKKMEI